MTVPVTKIADSGTNPYTAEDELGPYQGPNSDFAVREHEGYPHVYEGWAQSFRSVPGESPDEPIDFAVDGEKAPQTFFERLRGKDVIYRHSVEDLDADGWYIQKDGANKRAAPDPRRTPPPEPRPTQQIGPSTYSFTRPFDQGIERRNNGVHFSMADHERNYEILGMAPVRTLRNTYRIEPGPWDTDIVDMPPDVKPQNRGRIDVIDIPPVGNRSWRL